MQEALHQVLMCSPGDASSAHSEALLKLLQLQSNTSFDWTASCRPHQQGSSHKNHI
jgi:hypothetical protein